MILNARALGMIGRRLINQKPRPETEDVDGYFDDGFRSGRHGLEYQNGSLKLKANIDAYRRGWEAGYYGPR